jgi:predicted AlkP superfamily phosphohydrolase/phosphomutase
MSAEKWHILDDRSKAIWDRLDDKSKAIILAYQNDHHTSSLNRSPFCQGTLSPSKPPFYKHPMKTQANLHENSAYHFLLASMHDDKVIHY